MGNESKLITARLPWLAFREFITTDDSAITAFHYSDWPVAKTVKLNDGELADANAVLVAFYGTDADNEVLTAYKIYGRTRKNGPIILVATGGVVLGGQACVVDPITGVAITNGFWGDIITVTGGILTSDGTTLVGKPVLDSGANRIALLKFDKMGFEELYLEMDIGTAASIAAIITGH